MLRYLGSIKCKHQVGWQHLSQINNVAYVLKTVLLLAIVLVYHQGLGLPFRSDGAPLRQDPLSNTSL